MFELCDVGSLPFVGDFKKFLEGYDAYLNSSKTQSSNSAKYFETKVLNSFVDKIKSGIDVPTYPQFRDMNKMFLDSIIGLEKIKEGYYETGEMAIPKNTTQIKEVNVIKRNSGKIYELLEKQVRLKVCITGPYTLSCFFAYKDNEIFSRLGKVLSDIIEESIFNEKYGRIQLISVDEPTLGFIDDPLLDVGAGGREDLIKSWETIFHKAKSKNIDTCIHLHNTTNNLFWDVKSLKIIESHVNDPIYFSEKTKNFLSKTDKFLKASISISKFDNLIRNYIIDNLDENKNEISINQKLGEVWKEINNGNQDPTIYLESVELMQKRLSKIIEQIGQDKILYTGPECGLKSFPNYECALKCLETNSKAVKDFSTH
ncbi:MAG: hypothetical protein ACTSRG_16260 [Candidatus Helarchaeota archaeon]